MAGENEITGILNKYGAQISAELKSVIADKPVTKYGAVNASGQLKDSVYFKIDNNVLRVYALNYIYYLEKGREPTKNKGDGKLKKAIREWIDVKGITPRDNISKDSLAYLIARKIHKEGTTAYIQGGTKLVEDILNPELLGEIQSQLILTFREKTNAMMKSAIVGKQFT